jgi:hypothetical protein
MDAIALVSQKLRKIQTAMLIKLLIEGIGFAAIQLN